MGHKAKKLMSFFKKRRGITTYAEVIAAGFRKVTLQALLRGGYIRRVDRALYKLTEGHALSNPDLVTLSLKVPKGVVCLLSALAFHEATREVPAQIDLAIPRGAHANKVRYPPVRFYRFSRPAWKAGIENHRVDGHFIRIYSLSKTVADCFKFRNKIGADTARDVLKVAVIERHAPPNEIVRYAKICRVDNIIKPILEAIL